MSQTLPNTLPMPAAPEDNRFRVLILEDDPALAGEIVSHIARTGFEVHHASDSEKGLALFDQLQPHLLLMRVSNGAVDAHAFCRWVREKSGIPVVMLGPQNDAAEIAALKIGADDYLALPLRPAVLLARVVARLRRAFRYNTIVREVNPFGLPMDIGEKTLHTPQKLMPGYAECQRCDYVGPRANFEKEDLLGNIKIICPQCKTTDYIVISID